MVYSYRRTGARMGQNGSLKDEGGARFAAIREVRAYWAALRDDQDLPRREQINPRGMAGALHQVFMLERVAPGTARFRIAGMDINDLMGMEVRGMPLSALFDPAARVQLAEVLDTVFANHTITEVDLEADRGLGRPALRARLLLLPLKGASGEADLILGCLASDGQIGRTPRRFVIARVVPDRAADVPRLLHGKPFAPVAAPVHAPRAVPFGVVQTGRVLEMAGSAAPHPVADGSRAERPYLRLVRLED